MNSSLITEETLSIADDLAISDLLAQPELADVTIRFVCGVRKTLFSHNPDGELAEIESVIARVYHRLGNERRSAAFAASPARELDKAPKPEPVPARPVAPDFTLDNACEKVRGVIQRWTTNDTPKNSFTFEEIKRAIAHIHTAKGTRDWAPSDAETVTSGAKRWEQTLQTAMRKLRDLDEIAYRASKSDYFILR